MQLLQTHSADRTSLRLARWGEADRDVLLVHGLAEHIGRYGHVATALVDAGWRVTMVELRGHGESGGKRGHTNRWLRYVEDVQAAATAVGRPFVMVAHSMGGLVALSTLAQPIHPACLGVALSNPLLGIAVKAPAIKVAAAGLLSRILPRLSLANELDVQLISRDPEVVRAYQADPMVYSKLTPRWYTESQAAMASVHAGAGRYTLPMLMMLGTEDGICSHQEGRRFFEAYMGPKELRINEGLYHELFNEPEKEKVLADLTEWLDQLWGKHGSA